MQTPLTPSQRRLLVAGAALAVLGCNDATSTASDPGRLEVVQAPPSLGLPAAPLRDTIRVRLVDTDGQPMHGRLLTWAVRLGGGSISPVSDTTDADGVAGAVWTLGPLPGSNELDVTTLDDSVVSWRTDAEAFRVDQLDSDFGMGCGLREGDLWCWGDTWVSTPSVSVIQSNSPTTYAAPGLMAQGYGFKEVAVGLATVCALDSANTVRCYQSHQVAPDSTETLASLPLVPPMFHISGGDGPEYCGLAVSDSTAWCWNLRNNDAPYQVPGSPALIDLEMEAAVPLGGNLACGRLVDFTAVCWGDGALGDGTSDSSATPVPVSGGRQFAELALGTGFACGRLYNLEVWCWGRNNLGQLGYTGSDSPVPVLVTTGVTRLAAARYTVIAKRGVEVVRWGQFGDPFGANPVTPLASVAGLRVSDFSANDASCVRLVDGEAYCFGELFFHESPLDIDQYFPVQPVVVAAP